MIEVKDRFIESFPNDIIIVQIPFLRKRTRNRLERLLNIFDQDCRLEGNDHLLEIDENLFQAEDVPVLTRLLKAGVAPDVRRSMDVEDEILSEIEARDTVIMQKNQLIQQKDQRIQLKEETIQRQELLIRNVIRMLEQDGLDEWQIAQKLALPIEQIRQLK